MSEETPAPAEKQAKKRDTEESASPYSISVGAVYDGPLDLLLDLIRKQDIDIYDIPIAKITAQFLAYVEGLKQTEVDAAADFIYMASLLIHIKSRMLLPRAPAEAGEGESEDPRRELVERLLEHERFKNAAQMLMQKQQIEAATWSNPAIRQFRLEPGDEPEIAADVLDLVRVFQEILERARQRPVLDVDEDAVTGFGVVKEVSGFDVTMENIVFVDGGEAAEEGAEVVPYLGDGHVAVVELWVSLLVMGKRITRGGTYAEILVVEIG